jgi:hypothetical protein
MKNRKDQIANDERRSYMKKAYQKPMLEIHGSVKDLTQALGMPGSADACWQPGDKGPRGADCNPQTGS